jgi:hypothetical protein
MTTSGAKRTFLQFRLARVRALLLRIGALMARKRNRKLGKEIELPPPSGEAEKAASNASRFFGWGAKP